MADYNRNREIGEAVARNRAESDLSQKALADKMRARGFSWSQPTVAAIEKGERALRVEELPDLAAVLSMSNVAGFFSRPPEEVRRDRLDGVQQGRAALREGVWQYVEYQHWLARDLDRLESDGAMPSPAEEAEIQAALGETFVQFAEQVVLEDPKMLGVNPGPRERALLDANASFFWGSGAAPTFSPAPLEGIDDGVDLGISNPPKKRRSRG